MPPRVSLAYLNPRPLVLRSRAPAIFRAQQSVVSTQYRSYADDSSKLHPNPDVKPETDPSALPQSQQQDQNGRMQEADQDPTANAAPHVSEEAAAMAKVKGEQPPEMSQGTPVSEVSQSNSTLSIMLPPA